MVFSILIITRQSIGFDTKLTLLQHVNWALCFLKREEKDTENHKDNENGILEGGCFSAFKGKTLRIMDSFCSCSISFDIITN